MSERLFISFSGGETSAFMTIMLLANMGIRNQYSEIRTLFANTGEENEQTLDFVNLCDKTFGLNVEWVEAVVHHGERKASTGVRVDFLTAARNGEPFEEVIRKYGIPNTSYKHCTRELKLNPMRAYLAATGWDQGSYDTAIGIRCDEIDRISSGAKANRLIYPLVNLIPTTKPQVNTFWSRQSFRLGLKGYQGNCKWCWKKSLRKHMTLIGEAPEIYEFPARMEDKYGLVGSEFGRHEKPEGYRRVFFREGRSVNDLMEMKKSLGTSFHPAEDDSMNFALFDPVMDVGAGCEESCEVFADEDETTP